MVSEAVFGMNDLLLAGMILRMRDAIVDENTRSPKPILTTGPSSIRVHVIPTGTPWFLSSSPPPSSSSSKPKLKAKSKVREVVKPISLPPPLPLPLDDERWRTMMNERERLRSHDDLAM